jgi:hypothetical protein
MSDDAITLRNSLETAILAKRNAGQYTNTDFEVEAAYVPVPSLPEIRIGGRVWLILLDYEETSNQKRNNEATCEIPVQIGVQFLIDDYSRETCDPFIAFCHELKNTCRNLNLSGYTWLRTEPMRDESETPYSYGGMRKRATFESYFTAYYKAVIE